MAKAHLRWRLLSALLSLVLMVAVSASCWAAPTIEMYVVRHTSLLRSTPDGETFPSWARVVGACISDPEGPSNIGGATVEDPAGDPAQYTSIAAVNECTLCICAWWDETSAPPVGSYTLVAHSEDGSDSVPIVTAPVDHFPEPVPEITYPAPGSVITETVPVFEWLPYPGFACEGYTEAEYQWFDVTSPDEATWLWGESLLPDAMSVPYGGPPLEPGQSYTARLGEIGGMIELGGDPPGYLFEETRGDSTFHVSGPPTILGYVVRHTSLERSAYPDGDLYPTWARTVGIQAKDVSGPASITGVTVWDSAGNPLPSDRAFRMDQPDDTVCFCTPWEDASLPPVGSYALVAHDVDGNDSEPVITAPVDHFPEPVPDISYPQPGSVIEATAPLFTWPAYPGFACEGGAPAEAQLVQVTAPDEALSLWSQWLPPEGTSALYGSDGEPVPALEPGHSYLVELWQVGPPILLEDGDVWGYRLEEARRDCIFWVEPKFVGFLQPINDDGSSIFKLDSTVPVKFQLVNADGSYKGDAVATLSVAKVDNDVVGTYQEPASTSGADSGNAFRYVGDHYQFNLGTKGLSKGTWSLQVAVNGAVMKEVWISLR